MNSKAQELVSTVDCCHNNSKTEINVPWSKVKVTIVTKFFNFLRIPTEALGSTFKPHNLH